MSLWKKHTSFLKSRCRLCGKQIKGKVDIADKQSFKQELWLRFQTDVDVDMEKFTLLSYAQRVKGISTEYEAQQT